MNKLWILPTICFIIVLAWSVPSYYYQKAKILELQIIVDKQSNAIQQLEKEKSNTEVTIPQYLDSLPGYNMNTDIQFVILFFIMIGILIVSMTFLLYYIS